jgi:hypothetical protein
MTRKDYVLIAAALKAQQPAPHWDANKRTQYELDCKAVASAFASDNSRFSRERFLAACGLGE